VRRALTGGIGVLAATATLAASGQAAQATYAWSYALLLQRIDHVPVRVAGTRYRIDRNLAVCNGTGRVVTVRGQRRWHRFTCTQTVLHNGQLVDVTFGVRVVDERRFRLTNARYGP
jgi:hypothetical protein